jgi:hypothetical protein
MKRLKNFEAFFYCTCIYEDYYIYLPKIFDMETILFILLAYVVGVAIYTVVIKNDAMHKHDPHVKIFNIIKEGLYKMGIGFLITGIIITIIVFLLKWLN